MKKFIAILSFLVFSFIGKAHAIWPDFTPAIPVAPQLCPMCIPPAISEVLAMTDQVKYMKKKFEQVNVVTLVKQAAQKYVTQLGKSKFNELKKNISSRKKVVSYSRTIEDSSIADMNNEESVKEAFKKLFTQYPSKASWIQTRYKHKGDQFKIDTTVEMYITAREMEKELKGMLTELDNIERCLVAGEDCSKEGLEAYNCQTEESEDKVCLWRNALNAVRIYDKIMRYNEYLIAMNAQYGSVRSIGGLLKIKNFDGKDSEDLERKIGKKASLEDMTPYRMATGELNSVAAFAYETKFESLNDAGINSPLEGKEGDIASLSIIAEAQKKIDLAKESHNIKQNMAKYRKTFETYNEMKDYHNATLINLGASETCVVNYLSAFYDDSIKSWYGKGCMQRNGNIICHYASEKSKDDKSESAGVYDVLCPGDLGHKCYVMARNDYENRSGISGYLLALFDEAKAQETTGNTDIYISSQDNSNGNITSNDNIYMSTQDSGDGQVQDINKVKDQGQASYQSGDTPQNMKDPSAEEELRAVSRKNALINWTLGSVVAKAVEKDLSAFKPEFGNKKVDFPAWNDQKYFYDQYIDGKYENIKEYIKNEAFVSILLKLEGKLKKFVPDPIEIGSAMVRATATSQLKEIEKKLEDGEGNKTSKKLDELLKEERQVLEAAKNAHNQNMSGMRRRQAELYEELKNANTRLSDKRDEYNKGNEMVSSADNTTPTAQEGLDYGKSFERDGLTSPQSKSFNDKLASNKSEKQSGLASRAAAEREIQALENQSKTLQKELDNLKQEMENARTNFVKAYSDLEYDYKNKINEELEKKEKANLLSEVAVIADTVPSMAAANGLIQAVKQYALAQVDAAHNKLNNLKRNDQLYKAENTKKIVDIHKDMIDKIKSVDLEALLEFEDLPLISKLLAATSSAEEQKENKTLVTALMDIFGNVCDEIGCEYPDTRYFVGIMGKKEDFAAPKGPIEISSAPLREIFHFDVMDYNSIDKYYKNKNDVGTNTNITITGESILNSGLEIPKIWEYILKSRAFVEKDIDLRKLLNSGNPSRSVMRSGTFPCVVDRDKWLDIIPATAENNEAYYVRGSSSELDTSGFHMIQVCQGLSVSGGGKSITDREANAQVPLGAITDAGSNVRKSSELGQFFDYIPETEVAFEHGFVPQITTRYKLTFRQAVQRAVHTINTTENLGEGNGETDAKFQMYNRMFFDRNQFGDYLDNVEMEQIAADTLANMQIQVDDFRNMMKGIFEEIGYTLSSDFDLTDASDYNRALNVLEDRKNNNIRLAKEIQKGVEATTDVVKEKNNNLTHQIQVLEKDKDEVVAINGTEDLDELEEKIKNSKADSAIEDTYQSTGSDEFAQKMEKLRAPYCAVYPQ